VRYPACDVRAADLQQEPTKHFEKQSWFSDTVVSSMRRRRRPLANIAASGASHSRQRASASEAIKRVLGASGVEMG
jgi:hypothetical protein